MINYLASNIIPGGIFILVIATIRMLCKKLIPRWTFKVLELVAIAYMILPIQFSSSLSIYNLTSSKVVIENSSQSNLTNWITILWVIGGFICFLIMIRNYMGVHTVINRSIPLLNMDYKLTLNENIYYSDEISSPS